MQDTDPKQVFGQNVRRLRTAAGLSQEDLAARAGLHRTYISSIEQAQRNVSLENLFGIAKALGCDPSDLVAPPKRLNQHANGIQS